MLLGLVTRLWQNVALPNFMLVWFIDDYPFDVGQILQGISWLLLLMLNFLRLL